MSETEFKKLLEIHWQRELTASEEAALQNYLATSFDARSLWEEEVGLNHSLSKLPDVPLSTNFTARVLQAIEHETAQSARANRGISWLKMNWLPRTAIVGVFVCIGFFSVQQYQTVKKTEFARTEIARDVAAISGAATIPNDWLQDFEAINRLSQPPVDVELLAALQ